MGVDDQMARYKRIDDSPRFLPVDLSQQLLPGNFDHALNYLLDHELDLSRFDERFCKASKALEVAFLAAPRP